jgi:hypothetical protein
VATVAAVATDEPEIAAKPQVADERIGGAEQFAAHARIGHERAHQQKHWNDAEGVVGHRAHRGMTDDFQRRIAVDQVGKASDADEPHRHADRHAEQHQHEQRDKPQHRDCVARHRAHSTGLI